MSETIRANEAAATQEQTAAEYHARQTCRSCGSANLLEIVSLGLTYLSDFPPLEAPQQGPRAPLDLVLCSACSLLQLRHTVNPDLLWRHYWYRSGINDTMRTALAGITEQAERRAPLQPGDLVLDIGCNDGTLLRTYRAAGVRRCGFEPAANLQQEAALGTTRILHDYFNAPAFQAAFGEDRARIITSISMFYDLEDPNQFVADIVRCLHPEGLWINQMNYLPAMIEQLAFDNIGHEHLEYYSLASLEPLLERHGLMVADAEQNDLNGGSLRLYIRHRASQAQPAPDAAERLKQLRASEEKMGLRDPEVYLAFARRIERATQQLGDFVRGEAARGKIIYVYGASTRGSTLLQCAGLDRRWLPAAAERTPFKWGRKTSGTWIPIISEEQARRERPDYFLVLPWFFIEEFRRRERDYLAAGGRLIVPLPELRILAD